MATATLGVDIAWSKPTGAELAAAGVTVASLYVGQDNTGKNMTPTVVRDYIDHGVGVLCNFEYGAQQMLGGAAQGTIDAKLGLSQKRACGLPDTRPIIFSADWAAALRRLAARSQLRAPQRRFTAGQITNNVIPYLVAARAVLGPGLVGVYGSYYVVKAVADYWAEHYPGEKVWLWQTAAWSGGLVDPRIDFYQNATTIKIAGIVCDVDEILHTDVGQHPAPAPAPVDPPVLPKDEDMPQQIESLAIKPDGKYAYAFPKGAYHEVAFVTDTLGGPPASLRVVVWTTPANPQVSSLTVATGSTVLGFNDPAHSYAVTVTREDSGANPVGVAFV